MKTPNSVSSKPGAGHSYGASMVRLRAECSFDRVSRESLRVPLPLEEHPWQILGFLAILLTQGGLIYWLVYERRRRTSSEVTAHELSRKLISSQEEERARLARELHDDITQRLAVLALEAERAERASSSGVRD